MFLKFWHLVYGFWHRSFVPFFSTKGKQWNKIALGQLFHRPVGVHLTFSALFIFLHVFFVLNVQTKHIHLLFSWFIGLPSSPTKTSLIRPWTCSTTRSCTVSPTTSIRISTATILTPVTTRKPTILTCTVKIHNAWKWNPDTECVLDILQCYRVIEQKSTGCQDWSWSLHSENRLPLTPHKTPLTFLFCFFLLMFCLSPSPDIICFRRISNRNYHRVFMWCNIWLFRPGIFFWRWCWLN